MKISNKEIIIGALIFLLFNKIKKDKNMTANELPFLNKVKENKEAFANKVIEIANELNINPKWLMIVMNNESGLNPKAKNPLSSATGLIQFMEATAKSLGTTTKDIYNMSNLKQLDYVKKYMQPYAKYINSVGEAYLTVFYPLALFKPLSYEFPSNVVKVNKIFDLNKDMKLTKQEFLNYVSQKYSKYL